MNSNHLPDSYLMSYQLNEVKKSFIQYKLSSYEKIAFSELIRTKKNKGFNSSTGAENLLKIRDKTNWAKCTYTGLRELETSNFYYGDFKIKEKKSLVVVYLPKDGEHIYIRICPQFYPFNDKERQRIVSEIIKKMISKI